MKKISQLVKKSTAIFALLALVLGAFGLSIGTFSTTAHADPTNTTTVAASPITSTNATLNGIVGTSAADNTGFWVATSTFSTTSTIAPAGVYTITLPGVAAGAAFSAPLSSAGLPTITPGTTYYYAAWTEVSGVWSPGAILSFSTISSPTITSVAPNSGSTVGGTSVTITGTQFATGATVKIGGVAATGVTISPTSITATTPADTVGAQNVVITNADAGTVTLANGFTYITPIAPTPSVTTQPATPITSTDATLNGTNGPVAGDGTSFWVSTVSFSTSSSTVPAGVYNTPSSGSIAANTSFSASLSSVPGLTITPNTLYYYAAWTEVGGTWYPGIVMSFTTTAATPLPVVPTIVTVTPSNLQGWTTSSAAGAQASIVADSSHTGNGALDLTTTSDVNSVTHFTHAFDIPLSGLSQLSYDTKQIAAADATNGNATLRVSINLAGTGTTVDDQLMYEPYYNGFSGSTAWNTWTITKNSGEFWSNDEVTYNNITNTGAGGAGQNVTLADVLLTYPNAKIVGLVVSMGTYNVSQNVHVDDVALNGTTYNFVLNNPTPSVTTNDATLPSGTTTATVNGTNGPVAADNTSFWWGTTTPASTLISSADPATNELPSGWYDGVFAGQQTVGAPFSYALTGLSPSTKYYFVAWSQVSGTWYPGQVLNFTTGTVQECNSDATQTLVSDMTTTNSTDNIPAVVLSTINSAWTAVISGTKWIWTTDPVTDSTVNITKTFTKTFNIAGTPLDSSLMIAADNTYSVSVNNVADTQTGCVDTTGTTYSSAQTCDIPASMLTTGNNTLAITVTNTGIPGSTPQSNPAGLLYSLTVNENDCSVTPIAPTPSVTTQPATPITSTDATLNGTNGPVAGDGTSFWVSTVSFSTSSSTVPAGVYNTPSPGSIAANTSFSVSLSSVPGLTITPNTLYYYAAWTEVGGTWYPGQVLNFTTAATGTGTITGNATSGSGILLHVDSITAGPTNAGIADDTYADGWSYIFHITAPTNEPNLSMKFADWLSGANILPVAGNMRISSAQATVATPITLTAANSYSGTLVMTGDTDPNTAGRQVDILVEVQIPTTTVNGSYTTSYGVQTN